MSPEPPSAASSHESSHEAVRQAAREALQRGDVATALAAYERAIEAGQDTWPLRAEYAFLMWNACQFDSADRVFLGLLDDPNVDQLTLCQIAKSYFQTGRFQRAAQVMRVAVARQQPVDAETLVLLACCLERNNLIDPAQEQAEKALAISPTSGRATRLLAHIDKRRGHYDQAIARLQDQLRTHPSDFDWGLRYELAASLDRLGQYEQAWRQLGLAKQQTMARTQPAMQQSLAIRQRQWEFVQEVTDSDLTRWHAEAEQLENPMRLTFLAGFPRSGTTLLEQILASSEECIDTDETGVLSNQFTARTVWAAPTPGDAILEIRSWNREQLTAGRETYLQFTEAHIGQPIKNRLLIEKEPLLTPDLTLPMRLFPEASVLMPLRDPRDVVVSYYFTMVPFNWNSAPAVDIGEACRFYADCMRHWVLLRDRIRCRWFEPRYEEIVANPSCHVRQIAEFLELPWEESMLDTRHRSTLNAIRTPTYDDITKPIYNRAVARWKNYADFLAPALGILEPFVREFGYDT